MSTPISYIGIAKKAGKLVSGTDMVCDVLRRGGKLPVFAANDISDVTRKKLADKCAFYGAELIYINCSTADLAHGIGKTGAVAAVYINDAGLAAAAKKSV